MSAYSGTPSVARTWKEGTKSEKFVRYWRRMTLTLSSQGGATNNIPVTALGFADGFAEIAHFVSFVDGSAVVRALNVWTDGSYLYTGDPQTVTDADRAIPTDVSGTLVIEIAGTKLNY